MGEGHVVSRYRVLRSSAMFSNSLLEVEHKLQLLPPPNLSSRSLLHEAAELAIRSVPAKNASSLPVRRLPRSRSLSVPRLVSDACVNSPHLARPEMPWSSWFDSSFWMELLRLLDRILPRTAARNKIRLSRRVILICKAASPKMLNKTSIGSCFTYWQRSLPPLQTLLLSLAAPLASRVRPSTSPVGSKGKGPAGAIIGS